MFEIAETPTGFASTPTTLVTFYGETPLAGLIADAKGDLFGTTSSDGAFDYGTVFEIAKTSTGYASAPITLVSFSVADVADGAYPLAGLIADAKGDLFGTTEQGGASGAGTVFEIAKTAGGYASTPTILVSFNGTDGGGLYASLIADANGDLFGTTAGGGADGYGTVFEIAKTAGGYASTPTTLASFNEADGSGPDAGLIADADGDLFGTTSSGGAAEYGTVFEIKKTGGGYASTPVTLASFNGTDGRDPEAGLIADANGDLFGTTSDGGDFVVGGTVFEIKKTAAGYANTPTTLVSFYHDVGWVPDASLIANASGDLFGTTAGGGASSRGTVFEITNSGFVTDRDHSARQPAAGVVWRNASTGGVELWSPNGSGGFTYEPRPPSTPSWQIAETGDFTGSDEDGILWRNASTGGVELWNPDGSGGFTYEALSPVNTSWQVAGTGDFTGSDEDGILWRNASTGGVELWNPNGSGGFTDEALNPVNTSWQVAGTGDFTGGGEDGILWRNASTGGVELWNSNGSGGVDL